jgi:hypothetical protein
MNFRSAFYSPQTENASCHMKFGISKREDWDYATSSILTNAIDHHY